MSSFPAAPVRKLLRPAGWRRLFQPSPKYLAICAIIKNEARWIAEWIAYHRIVGVEYFILYDNNSTDGTLEIVRSLPDQKSIKIIPWPDQPGQLSAYQHAIDNFAHKAEWLAFFDADEYFTPVGADDVRPLLQPYEKYGALLVHWVLFGSNGLQRSSPSDLCIEMYTRRAPLNFPANCHVKSVTRTQKLLRVGWDVHVFAVDGPMATENFVEYNGPRSGVLDAEPTTKSLRLHHYFVKSREDWRIKVARGKADTDDVRAQDEFDPCDRNEEEDFTATRFAPQVRRVLGMAPKAETFAPSS